MDVGPNHRLTVTEQHDEDGVTLCVIQCAVCGNVKGCRLLFANESGVDVCLDSEEGMCEHDETTL
jgi:hypothetical protein